MKTSSGQPTTHTYKFVAAQDANSPLVLFCAPHHADAALLQLADALGEAAGSIQCYITGQRWRSLVANAMHSDHLIAALIAPGADRVVAAVEELADACAAAGCR